MVRLARQQFLFAYGSLCADTREGDRIATLHGRRRCWGVAMDNRERLPGYKHYVRVDGSRPAVQVAFLDVAEDAGSVDGVCRLVSAEQLAELDARERNYVRVDVTEQVAAAPGQVWTYVGSPAGRARFDAGRDAGTVVVSSEYWGLVRSGLARVGGGALERLCAGWDVADLLLWDLLRIDDPKS